MSKSHLSITKNTQIGTCIKRGKMIEVVVRVLGFSKKAVSVWVGHADFSISQAVTLKKRGSGSERDTTRETDRWLIN